MLSTLATARGQLGPLAMSRIVTVSTATTPEWQFVERITMGIAATTQDFATVLDGDGDLGYLIRCHFVSGAASASAFSLRVNGATIVCNRRFIEALGTGVSTAATAAATTIAVVEGTGGTAKECYAEAVLHFSRTGFNRIWRFMSSKDSSSTDWMQHFIGTFRMTTPSTATNITSLGVVASAANGIGAGTVLELFKKGG